MTVKYQNYIADTRRTKRGVWLSVYNLITGKEVAKILVRGDTSVTQALVDYVKG